MTESRSYLSAQQSPSLDEFKSHIRMTGCDLDGELEFTLLAAIQAVERYIGKTVARSSFTLETEFSRVIALRGPETVPDSVSVDGTPLSPSSFTVKDGRLIIDESVKGESLRVVYRAGYVSAPFDLRAAILLQAAYLFSNPVDTVKTLPTAAENLLKPYRY